MKNNTMIALALLTFSVLAIFGLEYAPDSEKFIFKSSLLGSVHLLALAVGLSGVFLRGIYLRSDLSRSENINRLFAADNAWGIAAIMWIITGLFRAFGGFDKGTEYYIHNPLFHLKLGLFGLVFFLEIWPMITFIRWRRLISRKQPIDFKRQRIFEKINFAEVMIIVIMVFVAGFIARGLFL